MTFSVENINTGNREYLTKEEEKRTLELHNSLEAKAYDTKQFKAYCKKNDLDFTKASFEKYLNNGQSVYKARVSEGVKQVFGITEYSKQTYDKLLSGENPTTKDKLKELNNGQDLTRSNGDLIRKNKNQQLGTDALNAAPKSVSILFSIADKETKDKIAEAMYQTSEQMVKVVSSQVKPSNQRTEYQDFDPSQTVLFANHFLHTDARPSKKEAKGLTEKEVLGSIQSHIHVHTHIANTARFAFYQRDKNGEILLKADGTPDYKYKMLACNSSELMKRQLENSSVSDCMLNNNLQERGIKTESAIIENDGKQFQTFRIQGISREQEEAVSTRRNDFNDKHKDKKLSIELKNKIFKDTKDKKLDLTANQLSELINNNTVNALGEDNIQKILSTQEKAVNKEQVLNAGNFKGQQFLDNNGLITETQLRSSLIRQLQHNQRFKDPQELNQYIDKQITNLCNEKTHGLNSLIPVKDKDNKIVGFTRLSNAVTERQYLKNVETLLDTKEVRSQAQIRAENKFLDNFINEAKKKGFTYNEGQIASMKESLKLGYEGGQILSINGAPGAGKTSSVIAFNVRLHNLRTKILFGLVGNSKIYGVSTANVATKALAEAKIPNENCINSTKLVGKAFHYNASNGKYEFNQKFVNDKNNQGCLYIFDEFGLEGTEKANLIAELCKKTNSRLLVVGDRDQLKSVAYGSALDQTNEILMKKDKSKVQFLTKIQRQKNERSEKIVHLVKEGDSSKLLEHLKIENALTTKATDKGLISQVAKDYLEDKAEVSQKIIVANTNQMIDELNNKIRDELKNKNPEFFKNEVGITVARQGTDTDIQRKLNFVKGERIVFVKGIKEKNPKTGLPKKGGFEIDNSQIATIKEIKRGQSGSYNITVDYTEADGNKKTTTFNTAKDGNYFAHSHCVSTYKSQGQTKLSVRHIATGTEAKNNLYVAMSRHTGTKDTLEKQGDLGYHLYINEKNLEKFETKLTQEQQKYTTIDNAEIDKKVQQYGVESVVIDNTPTIKQAEVKTKLEIIKDKALENLNQKLEAMKTGEYFKSTENRTDRKAIEAGRKLQAEKEAKWQELSKTLNLDPNEFHNLATRKGYELPTPKHEIKVEIDPKTKTEIFEANVIELRKDKDFTYKMEEYLKDCVVEKPENKYHGLKFLSDRGLITEQLIYKVCDNSETFNGIKYTDPQLREQKIISDTQFIAIETHYKNRPIEDLKEFLTLDNQINEYKQENNLVMVKNTQIDQKQKFKEMCNYSFLAYRDNLKMANSQFLNNELVVDKLCDMAEKQTLPDTNFEIIKDKLIESNVEKIAQTPNIEKDLKASVDNHLQALENDRQEAIRQEAFRQRQQEIQAEKARAAEAERQKGPSLKLGRG